MDHIQSMVPLSLAHEPPAMRWIFCCASHPGGLGRVRREREFGTPNEVVPLQGWIADPVLPAQPVS